MQIGSGTRVLVTGASRGIGEAIARALREARRHARAARAQARAARDAGRRASGRRSRAARRRRVRPRRRSRRPSRSSATSTCWSPTPASPTTGPFAAAAARRGAPHERRELARDDLHGLGRPAGHARARQRPHRDRRPPAAACAASRRRGRLQRHEVRAARLRRGAPARAQGTGVAVTTVYPGEIATSLHDHELDHMPDWYRMDRAPRRGRSASRSSRPWRTTSASSSIPRSCGCCGSPTGSRRGSATSCSAASSAGALRRDDASARSRRSSRSSRSRPRELPEGDDWCYEPKFDGFRTIVFRDGDDVLAPEPQRQPDEPLLPGHRGAGARAAGRTGSCSTARWSSRSTASRSSTCSRSASTRRPRAWSGSPRRRPPRSSPSTCSPRATRRCSSCPTPSAASGSRRS